MRLYTLFVPFLLLPSFVHSGGIPVIDATAIARQITQYQQTLKDYSTQLKTLGVENQQHLQMVKDYQQQIKEYKDYLHQVQGLRNIISRKDWDALFHTVSSYYGTGTYAGIATNINSGASLRDHIDRSIGELYSIPPKTTEVSKQMSPLVRNSQAWLETAGKRRNLYEQYRSQMEIVARNNNELSSRSNKIQRSRSLFKLDDKTDLQALQNVATSNYHILDELQASNQIQNQVLLHQNQRVIQALDAAESVRLREYQRLKALLNRPVQKNSFHWSEVEF